jgi:hypothetical protein
MDPVDVRVPQRGGEVGFTHESLAPTTAKERLRQHR